MHTINVRWRWTICLVLISLLGKTQDQKVDSNFHIYLLIGQSNMAGRGSLDSASKRVDPRILMLDSLNQWVPATDPVHFDRPALVGVGPAISFAKELSGSNTKIKVGLIPCAVGGSPISAWVPGAEYTNIHPYDEAIKRTRLAMQKGLLKGILWHQGESDNDSLLAALYIDKLKVLINRLRADVQHANMPFVAGEIGYFLQKNLINPVLAMLPVQVKNTAVVSAKDLTDKGDHLHFNTSSARELGRRYAVAMKQLQASGAK